MKRELLLHTVRVVNDRNWTHRSVETLAVCCNTSPCWISRSRSTSASPTHPLSWTHSRGKPPSFRWNVRPGRPGRPAMKPATRCISLQALRILSSVRPSSDYRTHRRSCNIRQTRSVMIPTEDYYRDNGWRMHRHDEGIRIAVIWQREVAMLRWSRWRDCEVIARALINYNVSDHIIAIIIIFIVSYRYYSYTCGQGSRSIITILQMQ